MPSFVLRPYLLRLVTLSPSQWTSSRTRSLKQARSFKESWIVQNLRQGETHNHTETSVYLSALVRGGHSQGISCGKCGSHLSACTARRLDRFSTGCRVQQAKCSESASELPVEDDWDGLEKWTRGGGIVHKLAKVDPSAVVEIGAIIQAHAVIGANTRISSGSVVGPHVTIGSHCKIGFNVALQNTSVGNWCVLHSGVCVGQDGFGFTVDENGAVVKKPQMLEVNIGNHVEIGANSCIDRGSWRNTVVGDHTKIDNLVQIGHNVVIGRCCMLCGQVGLAGSSTLGDYVVMGGKSGVADHVSVASKVRIAAKAAVTSNIVEPGDYGGFPAVPAKEWRRSVTIFRRLGRRSEGVTETSPEI